jgi:hypothetical protein
MRSILALRVIRREFMERAKALERHAADLADLVDNSFFFFSFCRHKNSPYATRSHMHTGPLVIATATPSFWLIPPRD